MSPHPDPPAALRDRRVHFIGIGGSGMRALSEKGARPLFLVFLGYKPLFNKAL
jgi:hypothetical protein